MCGQHGARREDALGKRKRPGLSSQHAVAEKSHADRQTIRAAARVMMAKAASAPAARAAFRFPKISAYAALTASLDAAAIKTAAAAATGAKACTLPWTKLSTNGSISVTPTIAESANKPAFPNCAFAQCVTNETTTNAAAKSSAVEISNGFSAVSGTDAVCSLRLPVRRSSKAAAHPSAQSTSSGTTTA